MKNLLLLVPFLFTALILRSQDLEQMKKEKPLRLSSGFTAQSGAYWSEDIAARQSPNTWSLAGTPTLEVYGIRFPFNFVISNQNRSIQQPFNQFGVAPTWRWIKVHAGYSQARFSNYTLAGRRFLGGGIELTPGLLRAGFVYGRFQKAVAYDSTVQRNTGQFVSNIPVPAFSRYGYAAKIGIGNSRNFLDFSYLKAKDRENSIQKFEGLTPLAEENAVFGVAAQTILFKKLTLKIDGAVSAYTRNLDSDTLEVENSALQSLFSKLLLPRQSTQILGAGESSIGWRDKFFGIKASYRRIDPDFKTMGAYFFQNDLEQYTIAPNLNLFKDRLQLAGSFGIQHNNLLTTKASESERVIGAASLNYNDNKGFFLNASFSNFGITQRPRANLAPVLHPDTLRVSQVSQAVTLSPGWYFGSKNTRHNLVFSVMLNSLNDHNPQSSYSAEMRTFTGNANYSIQLEAKGLNLSTGFLYQRLRNAYGVTSNQGLNASAQQRIAKDKGSVAIQGGWYLGQNPSESGSNSNTLQIGGQLHWNIRRWSTLSLQLTWVKYKQSGQSASSELFGNTGISFHF